jgi:hypothetical protein
MLLRHEPRRESGYWTALARTSVRNGAARHPATTSLSISRRGGSLFAATSRTGAQIVNEQKLLLDCVRRLNRSDVAYMLTGSMVSSAWGIPRIIHDLDFVIQLAPSAIPKFVMAFAHPDYFLDEAEPQPNGGKSRRPDAEDAERCREARDLLKTAKSTAVFNVKNLRQAPTIRLLMR